MARDEDRRAVLGERGDEVPNLASALGVKAVRRFVEDEELARREQGRRDGEPLPHTERVGAVALAGGREQADPVERGVDPGARGTGVAPEIGRVEAREVRPARE